MPGSAASFADMTARERAFAELRAAPFQSASFLGRAWATIFAVEGSLRVLGYKRTIGWIEGVSRSRSRAASGGRARGTSVLLGERLVRGAYRAHVFAGGCLPQSLVQYLLHRRDGTEARLVVGVRRSPANESIGPGIEAHAWVESGGAAPAGAEPFAPIFTSGDSPMSAP